jgi:hypothetical protein
MVKDILAGRRIPEYIQIPKMSQEKNEIKNQNSRIGRGYAREDEPTRLPPREWGQFHSSPVTLEGYSGMLEPGREIPLISARAGALRRGDSTLPP